MVRELGWAPCSVVRLHPSSHLVYFIPAENILEIVPGYGRWTQFLQTYATCLTLVDIAPRCIDACRSRFRGLQNLTCHVNDGRSLDMIEDESIDFVFSFNSLVHADSGTVRSYMLQIARKLRFGGTGFIHHSNLGAYKRWLLAKRVLVKLCRGSGWLGNRLIHDCMRAPDMTASLMGRFCQEAGLICIAQEQEVIPWECSRRAIDCFTIFKKEKVQPPPKTAQVVGQQAQRQPHLVRAEPMAREPRHLHRLLAFLDPLLRCPPLVVEAHHRPARSLQVSHDEPHSGEQLSGMELHLRHLSSYRLLTRRLVERALVPHDRLVTGRPTGRVRSSSMSRSRLSFAGSRMAYFTPRSSSAS